MEYNQISAIRFGDCIDVYVAQKDGNLKHYWANDFTGWIHKNETIWDSVQGGAAIIRHENNTDIYFLNNNRNLVHLQCGDCTNWAYHSEVLVEEISRPPVAVRWENDIDVYCFANGVLLNLHVSPSTNWQYEKKSVYLSPNYSSLFALRTKREAIDLYYLESGQMIHLYVGDHTHWEYRDERILQGIHIPDGIVSATRTDNCINLFFCDESGHVCHAVCGNFTGWSYQNRGPISTSVTARNKDFSVVQHENNIDIYFIGNDNCVHHSYNGVHNNFTWNPDEVISLSDAASGIVAVRPYQKAIDVYYLGQDEQLKHLMIGEGTNNDWNRYQINLLYPILQWENLRNFATIIGEGYSSKVYLIEKDSCKFVVKRFKILNPVVIRSEMTILNNLDSIWPNLCEAQIFENRTLTGFAMLYFRGQKLDEILQDKENIFHKSASARVQLIKVIGSYMNRIQKLGICHGDFSLENILMHQTNKSSKNDVTIMVIDYSNGFFFDANTRTQAVLTGWSCIKPSESKVCNPYDPSGVNAYQFTRVALQTLLLTPYSSYEKISSNPNHELKQLEKFGYDKSLINFLAKGTHLDITRRNTILNEIDSTRHLDSFDDHHINSKIDALIKGKEQSHPKHETIEDSELPEISTDQVDSVNSLQVVYDFIQKNLEIEWSAVEGKSYTLLYASAGISIEDDIFFTLSAEAKIAVFKIISDSGSNIEKVDIDILKVQVGTKIGAYSGYELYVALIEGQVSIFDIRIALGMGTGVGTNQDSCEIKAAGTGFFVGRRMGISVFDCGAGIDFKTFFSDEQWNTVRPIVHSALQHYYPQAYVLGEVSKAVGDFMGNRRTIDMTIENFTLNHFALLDQYFDCGTLDKNCSTYIKRGDKTEFSACKKVEYYGVEGTIIYRENGSDKNVVFSFFNPIGGDNSVVCRTYRSDDYKSDAKSTHYESKSKKEPTTYFILMMTKILISD